MPTELARAAGKSVDLAVISGERPMTEASGRADPPIGGISRGSLAIAAFSTIVEWYDFTLYLYFVTVLSRVFFGEGGLSLLTTLGGFALAYLMRPLGAVFFGHIGDRHGRRHMLLLSVALMTAAMLATALLPTFAQIGPMAGVLLFLLRCVTGFAVGGEYTGVVAYLLEGAPRIAAASSPPWPRPPARSARCSRSVFARSPSLCSTRPAWLAGAGASPSCSARPRRHGLDRPFGDGGIARVRPAEGRRHDPRQPAQAQPRQPSRRHRPRLRHLGPGLDHLLCRHHLRPRLPDLGRGDERGRVLVAFDRGGGGGDPGHAVRRLASDRLGRRPVLVVLALANALLPIALFAAMASGSASQALVGAVLLAALAGGVSAVGAVATAEQFPGEGRVTGLALGATGATAIFGGLTPFLAQLLVERTGWAMAPGAMIALVGLSVLPLFLRMKETAPARTLPASPDL